jgi:hypothetical protein
MKKKMKMIVVWAIKGITGILKNIIRPIVRLWIKLVAMCLCIWSGIPIRIGELYMVVAYNVFCAKIKYYWYIQRKIRKLGFTGRKLTYITYNLKNNLLRKKIIS